MSTEEEKSAELPLQCITLDLEALLLLVYAQTQHEHSTKVKQHVILFNFLGN